MINIKENLDNRVCDINEYSENTQTFREWARCIEIEFSLPYKELDMATEFELNKYLSFLSQLYK